MAGGRWLRNTMIAGLLAVFPLFLTFWALNLLFKFVDGFLSPIISPIIGGLLNHFAGASFPRGARIPGVGLAATLLLILLAGLLVRYVVSRRILEGLEGLIGRIPLVGPVFSSMRKLLGYFRQKRSFSEVVAVEYPLRGTYALAFVTGKVGPHDCQVTGKPMSYVFVVTTPNPSTGFLLAVPDEAIVRLPISVEEGVKLIVTAGALAASKRDDEPAGSGEEGA